MKVNLRNEGVKQSSPVIRYPSITDGDTHRR